MSELAQASIREVLALHLLFASWLGRGEGDLARLEAVLAPEFRMIDPDGASLDRRQVLATLGAAGGLRGPAFAIEIADAQAIPIGEGHALATYVERQTDGGTATARRSSALFRRAPQAPLGVAWLHLHETWLAAA